MSKGAVLKWHGGKHYLARRIVALMPPHVHYVEPYFGGGAVLLAKQPDGISEVANDLNGRLVGFWRVCQDETTFARFARIIEAVPFSEAEWHDAADRLNDPDPVTAAVAFFIRCRQSLAGRMDSFAPLSRNRTRRCMNEQASAWLSAVEGLPAVHARLKRVAILNRPALEVIGGQDGPGTLFYLDPPYLPDTRAAAEVYANEMTVAEHEEMLALLANIQGKAMVSGYPSALYESRLAGWNRHEFDLANHSAGGASKRRMSEVVWCNF